MTTREPLRERMRGRWHGVLPMLGVPAAFLTGKHQPCPMCGGKDRARYDDKDGLGSYICGHCGAGDGISLVMKINGWDFKTAAARIETVGGTVEPKACKPKPNAQRQKRAMREAWGKAQPIGSAVRRYLFGRGIDAGDVCDLRENERHEMLALLRDVNGNGCQIHRTLLTEEGRKAAVNQPRLFMPGPIAKGAAVRLLPHAGELGIAEGIETALSASILFDMPCWAALNTTLLRQWEPPADVQRVVVFSDNDVNCAGQSAAFELARQLASKIRVTVEMPKQGDTDWNDVLQARAAQQISKGEAA